MVRPVLELADIFREHGPAWREANRGHASLDQLKVMSAIERCRTAALGGHVARCENLACGHTHVAFNSCRDRHCPKCQAAASRRWLADREAELLPVPYFHVVYTLPGKLRDIAWQNKRVVYDLLMKAAAETTLAIAADPKRLGARIGITAVLHTWGSALTHHPHVHMIVPGGPRPAFLLPVRVLGKLFRRLFLTRLIALHDAGRLASSATLHHLPTGGPSCATSRRSAVNDGRSTPSRPLPVPKPCSPISRVILTASPSRTGGCSASTRPASPSATRTTCLCGGYCRVLSKVSGYTADTRTSNRLASKFRF